MHRVVPALERARASRSRKVKVAAIAEALRLVARDGDDDDLATAARLIAGDALPAATGATVGIGFALVMDAACSAYQLVPADLRAHARTLGDLGDAVGALAALAPDGEQRPGLTIADVRQLASALAATTDRSAKTATLREAYRLARPDQATYLTKLLLGELRIGVREGILEEAIAAAFARDAAEVRDAATVCTDPGELAILASHDELSRAVFVVGSPVAFMLASPIESVKAAIDATRTVWEDKLDGIRVQLHASPALVKLFARGGGEVSAAFPEIVRAFVGVAGEVVIDAELLAVNADLKPRPFQALQARLNRRDPDDELVRSTPVALFAFDMLYDGGPLLARPWFERRARLDRFFSAGAFGSAAQVIAAHAFEGASALEEEIDQAHASARARGHEGLVLKEREAAYEAGRRGSAWRKVKRALGTLDVVITRAERGHGKRAKVLSDYTFAVWDTAGPEPTLVDIGKAYSGLTDIEISALTVELLAQTRETVGAQLLVRPTIVLEVAFDGLQPSTRHPSGFALRFPRIARIRADKRPEDADTLATARALFLAQVASGHREEGAADGREPARPAANARGPARKRARARGKAEPTAVVRKQLRLFGDDDDDA